MNLGESSIMIEHTNDLEKKDLFFDTYAFFEILKGNTNYKKYEKAEIITTKLNMFELYLGILRHVNTEDAQKVLDKYYPFVTEFGQEVIKDAALLKIALNERDVSMTDCIGYCLAKQLGIKFLTGDSTFENLENVEFTK